MLTYRVVLLSLKKLKLLLFIISVSVIYLACSAKKHPYYFSAYSIKSTPSIYDTISNATILDEMTRNWPPCSTALKEIPSASISKEYHSFEGEKFSDFRENVSSPNLDNRGVARQQLRENVKSDDPKKGDKKKNGFAIAGFITSIIGMLFIAATPFLLIIGVILSAIGLKSEKRGLAIAGMIIGFVGVALWLLILIAEILSVGVGE